MQEREETHSEPASSISQSNARNKKPTTQMSACLQEQVNVLQLRCSEAWQDLLASYQSGNCLAQEEEILSCKEILQQHYLFWKGQLSSTISLLERMNTSEALNIKTKMEKDQREKANFFNNITCGLSSKLQGLQASQQSEIQHAQEEESTKTTVNLLSWADNSKRHKAEQMELSRDCSSTVPDCSEDTFATFREEKGESCRQYENESFESYYSREESEWPTGSDLSEDTQQLSSQNDEEQEPDFLDPAMAKKALILKWISRLKDGKSSTQLAECANKPGNALIIRTEAPEEEWEAVRSFCAIKTDHLNHPPSSALSNRRRRSNQKQRFPSEEVFMHEVNHIVPDQLVNRLRLKNLQKSMEQLVETEMHQPSQCSDCENKRAQLAEDAFLRRKKTVLEGVLLQEKLKDHLYTQDALLIIGKMHQSLPKLSDDPRDIWRKLKERALQAEGMALPEPSPKQKQHVTSRAPALSHGE